MQMHRAMNRSYIFGSRKISLLALFCTVGLNRVFIWKDGTLMENSASAFIVRAPITSRSSRRSRSIPLHFYVNSQRIQQPADISSLNVTEIYAESNGKRGSLSLRRSLPLRWRSRKPRSKKESDFNRMREVDPPVIKIHNVAEKENMSRKSRITSDPTIRRNVHEFFTSSNHASLFENESKGKGENLQLKFVACKTSKRRIGLSTETLHLFHDYMTQSPEKYSLISSCNDVKKNKISKSRRWFVRRLDKFEAATYQSRSSLNPFKTESCGDGDCDDKWDYDGNFFRLAVPLNPIIGLELTPVVDLEVSTIKNNLNILKSEKDEIYIRSCKVALLSTDEEVHQAMENKKPLSSSVSRAVESLGNDTIFDVASTIQKWLKPHLVFSGSVTWNVRDHHSGSGEATISVKAKAEASLAVPDPASSLPIGVESVIKKIGSLLTGRILMKLLPKFLNQIERDFNRWSKDIDSVL
mmetsp:Transcript_24191/g.48098  ORF Transcript_24191/g.48098 Transcript_24191/m.48098 type:complete len:468 (+) Transcript_24191:348-1751(+)